MKILFAAGEAAPYMKSGGLGDVMEALPKELSKSSEHSVAVMMPYYKSMKLDQSIGAEFVTAFYMPLAWRQLYVGIFKVKRQKVTYYFIDNEYYFYRDGGCYGHYDDGERFAYFSKAVLEALRYIDFMPDVIHANDWQAAAIPVFYKAFYSHISAYSGIRTVFTIHNIEYQGKMPLEFAKEIMGLPSDFLSVTEYGGCTNLMKSAIVLADKITTVSKTYAHEILHAYFAHGLDPILRENAYKLCGIVNGINTAAFNPRTNKNIVKNYSLSNLTGKAACKAALQEELGLAVRSDVPVVAMVSRLVAHKGLELVECVLPDMMRMDIQLVILGTGDGKYEDMFRFAAYNYGGHLAACICFDPALADRVYAGSDIFLMPSKSEPCGLSQLIAMRYGTIPVVRETGGLFDTVPALNTETMEGTGFTFKLFNAHDMLYALQRAVGFWQDAPKRTALVKNLMRYDSSWKEPVKAYQSIYESLR